MSETISARAHRLFSQARQEIANEIQQVVREHNRDGLLRSGATIKRFIRVHTTTTQKALTEAIESIGRRVQSRGYRWRRMIEDVRRELDAHLTETEQALVIKLTPHMGDDSRKIEPLALAARERLHRTLQDYQEGWTGDPGKPWSERRKWLYTSLVALGGALSTKLVELLLTIARDAS